MSTLAGKTRFGFEPKMAIDFGSTGTVATPEVLQPSLGTLAVLSYKPTRFCFNLKVEGVASTADATIKLKAGSATVWEVTQDLSSLQEFGDDVPVDLSQVSGEAKLALEVTVNAADAGLTGVIDAFVDVEQPVIMSGC